MRETLYTVRGPKTMAEMSWVEVEAALRDTSIVVVPLGSTEQHGPHMPLGVDTMLGVELSRRVVERLGQEGLPVVAGPTIPFGASPNMEELAHPFPGTISLRLSTLIAVIKDVCRALYEQGFRKIVLVTTHAENHGPAQVAAKELAEELPDPEVLYLAFGPVTAERHREHHEDGPALGGRARGRGRDGTDAGHASGAGELGDARPARGPEANPRSHRARRVPLHRRRSVPGHPQHRPPHVAGLLRDSR